jgi:serine protease AprX
MKRLQILLFLLVSIAGLAQTTATKKYLVLLKDKAATPYTTSRPTEFLSSRAIQRRQKQGIAITDRDFPPNPSYLAQIRQTGAKVWYGSRWFNAALVEATDMQLTTILKLAFVNGIDSGRSLKNARVLVKSEQLSGNNKRLSVNSDQLSINNEHQSALITDNWSMITEPYGASADQINQLGVNVMHGKGFHGEGMLIAVLDAGFLNADKVAFLKPLFDEKRIVGTYDFVQRETSVYEDDDHGLSVLSTMAATADNALYGSAYKASYLLLRTEDVPTESRLEEANWLIGAEYADSTGADLITASLGYTTFDDAATDYTYKDLNGTTSISSRAATIASEVGIVVLSAAGNDGTAAWKYISVPADAVPVLAVAAVDRNGNKASFSSFGPAADGRIKPDVAARGQTTVIGLPTGQIATGNGTSFATPLLAGMVAGFWQAYPNLKASEVVSTIRKAGSQYKNPDDRLGYGIPTFPRAASLAESALVLGLAKDMPGVTVWPVPFSEGEVVNLNWPETTSTGQMLAVSVANALGRVVWHSTVLAAPTILLPLGNAQLSAGFYLLTVESETTTQTVRVLKQ